MSDTTEEKPNGKTTPPAWEEGAQEYSAQFRRRVLALHIEGRTYADLSQELGIPALTMRGWATAERKGGTELGKALCNDIPAKPAKPAQEAQPASPPKLMVFPSGTTYKAGENGKAVLVEPAAEPAPPTEPAEDLEPEEDEDLADEILGEVALRLGRREIEIISLKARLARALKAKCAKRAAALIH